MNTTIGEKLIDFYLRLQPPQKLPKAVSVLYPQQQEEVQQLVKAFFKKFYAGDEPRRRLFGINPGRLGAGITGINFTAPKQLKENCCIDHPFKTSSELSAEFIYDVIEAYGGPAKFYRDWFIAAVCPLGFIKEGKNINYYDEKKLLAALTPYIIHSIRQQLSFGFKTDYCICIGEDKNLKFLRQLNEQHHWFDKIVPVPHPRFIMQYRRKEKAHYIRQYQFALTATD